MSKLKKLSKLIKEQQQEIEALQHRLDVLEIEIGCSDVESIRPTPFYQPYINLHPSPNIARW